MLQCQNYTGIKKKLALNVHFLSRLSLAPAHSSNSGPHCPLSPVCAVVDFYLPNSLSPSPSANPLLTSPIRAVRSLASPTLASFFAPSDSSDQRPHLPRGTIQDCYQPICPFYHSQF